MASPGTMDEFWQLDEKATSNEYIKAFPSAPTPSLPLLLWSHSLKQSLPLRSAWAKLSRVQGSMNTSRSCLSLLCVCPRFEVSS